MTPGDIALMAVVGLLAYLLFHSLVVALVAAVLAWPIALIAWGLAAAVFPRSEP